MDRKKAKLEALENVRCRMIQEAEQKSRDDFYKCLRTRNSVKVSKQDIKGKLSALWIIPRLPHELVLLIREYERTCVLYTEELSKYDWKMLCWNDFQTYGVGDWQSHLSVFYNLAKPKPVTKSIISSESVGLQKHIKIPEFAAIAYGRCHAVIQRPNGALSGYGKNYKGQLGHYTVGGVKVREYFESSEFIDIVGSPTNVVQIACGGNCTMLRLSDGSLMVCGNESVIGGILKPVPGNLGILSTFRRIVVPNIIDIACGMEHCVVLTESRKVMVYGDNHFGQLGLGRGVQTAKFVEVAISNDVTDVVCGDNITMIKRANRTIMACGDYEEINKYTTERLRDHVFKLVEISMSESFVDCIFQ